MGLQICKRAPPEYKQTRHSKTPRFKGSASFPSDGALEYSSHTGWRTALQPDITVVASNFGDYQPLTRKGSRSTIGLVLVPMLLDTDVDDGDFLRAIVARCSHSEALSALKKEAACLRWS